MHVHLTGSHITHEAIVCLCSCLDLDVGYILNYRRVPVIESDWPSGILYNNTGIQILASY